jgi:hypothetical protein
VSLNNEAAKKILITKGWGFIAVKTEEAIFVFTVNGILMHRIPDSGVWRDWFTFRTRDGVDWIVINGVDGTIKWFEAGEPGNGAGLQDWRGMVCAWVYCWRFDCFFIVLETGQLLVQPRPPQKA